MASGKPAPVPAPSQPAKQPSAPVKPAGRTLLQIIIDAIAKLLFGRKAL